jgi:hypothetical protein
MARKEGGIGLKQVRATTASEEKGLIVYLYIER